MHSDARRGQDATKELQVIRSSLAIAMIHIAAAIGALAGCAAPVADGTNRDRMTASDQTDTDRRARLRMELASGYYSRGQLETALDEVKQALAVQPDMAEAYNLRGLIYEGLGDDRLAEESYKHALKLKAGDPDTMHNYGWFLCQRKRIDESLGWFKQAIATPKYAGMSRSLMTQGICQARANALAEADRSLSRAYELEPGNPVVAVNLADVLYRRGELERARFYIGRVNSVQEYSNAQTLWLAARIENKMGNSRGARDLGRQLRARFPQAPETQAFERGRYDD
jgi:type IV pilus assembly protein PilF